VLPRLALVPCAIALLVPTALQAQLLAAPPEPAVVLHTGDAVRINVWRRAELSGEFAIGDDGSIMHPLYRAVRVSGLPIPAVEERLRTFLTQFDATPAFVLEPLLRVTLAGQINRPNVYTLPPRTTIAQAVAVAGGPTDRGALSAVQLVRDGRVLVVDLTRPDATQTQMPIRSGDQIMVVPTRSVFREVVAPSMTVVGAVAAVVSVIMRSQR
jgi:polysaccharide biosynthesis/export protein